MGQVDTSERTFHVHARHEGRDRSHRVEAKSFEEAAIGFVERWHPAETEDGSVSVLWPTATPAWSTASRSTWTTATPIPAGEANGIASFALAGVSRVQGGRGRRRASWSLGPPGGGT